jgi:phosphoglycolate phosphatase
MATIDAVLFDLDGTLLDSARDFHRIINRMLNEAGREPIEFSELRTQVSNGARAMVMHAFKLEQDADAFPALHQQLLDYYGTDTCQDSRLFDEIEPLLSWLEERGIRWGIVTNKPQRFTLTLLDRKMSTPANPTQKASGWPANSWRSTRPGASTWVITDGTSKQVTPQA